MTAFRLFLVLGWAALIALTAVIAARHGFAASFSAFSDSYAGLGWPAFYNSDFMAHLALAGLWVGWRHGWTAAGILLALCAGIGGAMFTFLYLLVLIQREKGDMRRVLLGVRA